MTNKDIYKIFPCDSCRKAKEVLIVCKKCRSNYCSKSCQKEDEKSHDKFCEVMDEETIKKALIFFQLDPESYQPIKDSYGNRYLQLPGPLEGITPPFMLSIVEKNSVGRKIWEDIDVPTGTLDVWRYVVRYVDLPRLIVRLDKELMLSLLHLLHLYSPKK